MLKELIKLANHLDSRGLRKEADYLDHIIKLSSSTVFNAAKRNYSDRGDSDYAYMTRVAISFSRYLNKIDSGNMSEYEKRLLGFIAYENTKNASIFCIEGIEGLGEEHKVLKCVFEKLADKSIPKVKTRLKECIDIALSGSSIYKNSGIEGFEKEMKKQINEIGNNFVDLCRDYDLEMKRLESRFEEKSASSDLDKANMAAANLSLQNPEFRSCRGVMSEEQAQQAVKDMEDLRGKIPR
jgi:hypothetical protein